MGASKVQTFARMVTSLSNGHDLDGVGSAPALSTCWPWTPGWNSARHPTSWWPSNSRPTSPHPWPSARCASTPNFRPTTARVTRPRSRASPARPAAYGLWVSQPQVFVRPAPQEPEEQPVCSLVGTVGACLHQQCERAGRHRAGGDCGAPQTRNDAVAGWLPACVGPPCADAQALTLVVEGAIARVQMGEPIAAVVAAVSRFTDALLATP